MRFLSVTKDGGQESTVWAYWLIEVKPLFSVAILRFENGSRDAFHTHAFNAVSWLLWGQLGEIMEDQPDSTWFYYPSLWPIITKRETFHKVVSIGRSWVLTFRGPWDHVWEEKVGGQHKILTHGRRECRHA